MQYYVFSIFCKFALHYYLNVRIFILLPHHEIMVTGSGNER